MDCVAGVDIGSATTKAVILKPGKVLGRAVVQTGPDNRKAAHEALQRALADCGLARDRLRAIVSTGYGRERADFADASLTEIACHSLGAKWLLPKAEAVIDIGGQDSKAMVLDAENRVEDFVMNDKCAAGTGRFIELICRTLQIELADAGRVAAGSSTPAQISSMCAVFAESEVISLVAEGVDAASILAGVHVSVAQRVAAMATRLGLANRKTAFTGGVALNGGMVKALAKELGTGLLTPKDPQVVGAIGAALFAAERIAGAGR